MWLDTWLINWLNDDVSPFFLGAFDLNSLHEIWQLNFFYCNVESLVARQQNVFVCKLKIT